MPYDTKHCVILLLLLMKPMIADRQPKLQNDASCPRPRVGKCSCEQIGPYTKVTCKGLDALPEKLPRNTTYIKITDGNIKEIPDNYFLPLKYLQSLELQNNKISNRFRLPQDLWSLDLGGNMLNSSSLYGMFDGLSKLRRLDISFNPIKGHLVPGTFSSLRELVELMITFCHLNDIKEGTFSGLIHLHRLNLESNDLQILKKGAFKGMKSRQDISMTLSINGNKIAYIEDGTFEDTNTIDHLSLARNRLTSLPDLRGILEKNSILNFDNNCISNISSLSKSGLKTITQLSLFANKVSIMPLFKNIRILQELRLASNNIKEIPARFLDNSPTLSTLTLNNNQIEKIHKDSFMGLKDLQELYLFNNVITQLPDGVFANLTLKYLFLNGNRLKKLTGRPFKGMKKTKTAIYFFGNDIQHIDNDYFNDLGNETMVDFRCKSLKDLPHIQRSSLSRITCAPNQLGWIRELNNQAAYSLATSGFFCNKTDSNDWNCIPCNVGSFQAKRDNDPCSECSAGGFYQDEMAQTKCKECNIGTYVHPNNTPGSTPLSCQACPQGKSPLV
ncbi:leucine-rich repeat-containing protein 15-like [Actinia tenebrosa]|uniref:Leucine-rich repeat-containing protein 15-like n=1 Tax=Actinia tenebrosa TaxID=6105 RepID=A0A6P8I8W6_ACTTE|nr:leucine-rich repeat-containing protein 15-like [Actinia tenebrosa]